MGKDQTTNSKDKKNCFLDKDRWCKETCAMYNSGACLIVSLLKSLVGIQYQASVEDPINNIRPDWFEVPK